ncbi:hypothetical protein EV648_107206 [Kribbella sp. VKM Ac-2568]|nr:hypothetical protein EV648_107206 [Kribbella sp. VKM Ac-2568]
MRSTELLDSKEAFLLSAVKPALERLDQAK